MKHTLSSAMAIDIPRGTRPYRVPPFDPARCKAKVKTFHYDTRNHMYFKEQCSRIKGYGPNDEYCWQHAKTLERKFGV